MRVWLGMVAGGLMALTAGAQSMVYNSVFTYRVSGGDVELKQSSRGFVVFDAISGNGWRINYGSMARGIRFYTLENLGALQSAKVIVRSRTNTVVSFAGTDQSSTNGVRVIARAGRGADSRLTFRDGPTVYLPKRLQWTGFTVLPSDTGIGSEYGQEVGTTTLDGDSTARGFALGETVTQTVERIIANLREKGYREVEFK